MAITVLFLLITSLVFLITGSYKRPEKRSGWTILDNGEYVNWDEKITGDRKNDRSI